MLQDNFLIPSACFIKPEDEIKKDILKYRIILTILSCVNPKELQHQFRGESLRSNINAVFAS
jgi:hypothetical protein